MKLANVSSPLSGHEILRTSCPSAALATMSNFGALTINPVDGGPFCLKVDAISIREVVLAHGYHGDGTDTSYDTTDYYWQAFSIAGSCRQSSGKSESLMNARNWSALYSPGEVLASRATAGYQQLTAKIRAEGAREVIASLIGQDIDDLMFDAQADCSSPRLQSLRRTVFSLASELNVLADRCFPNVLLELEQTLLVSFVLSHHHNYSSILHLRPKAPSSNQLALVEEYIAANWDKPLDVRILAEVCNVSARSVFRYFKERRGCSPSEFIKNLRLQHCRNALLAGDDRTTVVATALKTGFASLGHFARNYRQTYGENPSETLALALRRSGKARGRTVKHVDLERLP